MHNCDTPDHAHDLNMYDRIHSVRHEIAATNACAACETPIAVTDVLVLADSTGCESVAVDPYHLACYLTACDTSLESNLPLAAFARRYATAAIDFAVNARAENPTH